jgi:hypothetical protein
LILSQELKNSSFALNDGLLALGADPIAIQDMGIGQMNYLDVFCCMKGFHDVLFKG